MHLPHLRFVKESKDVPGTGISRVVQVCTTCEFHSQFDFLRACSRPREVLQGRIAAGVTQGLAVDTERNCLYIFIRYDAEVKHELQVRSAVIKSVGDQR